MFVIRRLAKFCNMIVLQIIYFVLVHTPIWVNLQYVCIYSVTTNQILNMKVSNKNKWTCKENILSTRILTVYSLYLYDCKMYVKDQPTEGKVIGIWK